ncbi:MAG TPA: metallophosphoesterase [Longimicrobium sp.]|nr:metallophosphoesterase [Longimicrobium sp.]
MNRRRFLAVAGTAAAGAAALAVDGLWYEPRRALDVTTHHISTAGESGRLTFAQITDLHLHAVGGLHRRIAAEVRRASPDFVVVTGDAIDRADRLPALDEFLSLLDPRLPKYAILGNWEHWANVDLGALAELYARHGGRLLVNETVLHESRGGAVAITGLDDLVGGRPDVYAALWNAPDAPRRLLLAHCPEYRDRLAGQAAAIRVGGTQMRPALDPAAIRFDAILSGHTHGGQVRVLGWAPIVPRGSGRYLRGWFRDDDAPPLYVCRGVGTSMLPVRLGCTPELAVFTLG